MWKHLLDRARLASMPRPNLMLTTVLTPRADSDEEPGMVPMLKLKAP
jgi:hypothetical protein